MACPYRIACVGAVNQFTMRIKGYRSAGGVDGELGKEGEERRMDTDDGGGRPLQKRAKSIRFSREALKLSRVKYTAGGP